MKTRNSQNSEMEGQIKLLEEVKKRMSSDRLAQVDKSDKISVNSNPQIQMDPDIEYKKSVTAMSDIKKSLNMIKQLKNELENNYNGLIKNVARNLVRPDSLLK